MIVLGVAGFMHDYNCCLINVDKKQIAMCEAERLSRRKHHTIMKDEDLLAPIWKCCEDLGCRIKDIDTVVFGHTDPFECRDWLVKELGKKNYIDVDHHTCHAAGAFFSSPYDKALIASFDGFGDGSSALIATGEGNKITELWRIDDTNSLGLEYLRATIHLGLGGYGSEGKTQGLAPYGEPTLFEDYMNEIDILPDGGMRLSKRLLSEGSLLTQEGGYLNTQLLFNAFLNDICQRRIVPEPLTDTHKNLAASIQKVLEHVVTEICLIARNKTGMENLVLSGGVSMNSSLNGELLKSGEYKRIFSLPMASDRGIGVCAALYHIHQNLDVPRFYTLNHVFYGGEHNDKAAQRAMKKGGLKYEKCDDIIGRAAQAIADGKIVGWFQGRSEMGARALGHRSILADPRIAEMKDIINSRVKHREWFRPFAPSVLDEKADEYFETQNGVADLSYMTFTVKTRESAKDRIPAVVHVDDTARIQTVKQETNPMYAELIRRYEDITGIPVILNTSFNDKGEPIVETPVNAVNTFLKADMDLLCIGNIVGTKS